LSAVHTAEGKKLYNLSIDRGIRLGWSLLVPLTYLEWTLWSSFKSWVV